MARTVEAIESINYLKMSGLNDNLQKMIESDRNKEYKAIKKRMIFSTIQKGFVKGMYPLISLINVSTSSKWFLDKSSIMGVVIGLRIIRMLELPITWFPFFYATCSGY